MLTETNSEPLKLLRVGAFNNRNQLLGGWAVPYRKRLGMRFSQGFDFFYCGPMLLAQFSTPSVRQISERQQILTELSRAVAAQTDLVVAETHPNFRDVRPLLFEEWVVSPEYTHIWDTADTEQLLQGMNREKRREIRLAKESFRFGREAINQSTLDWFMAVYREAMRKLSVNITINWEAVIRTRVNWMEKRDACRLYAARNSKGEMLAAVLVLISQEDRTAYYWRMGYTPSGRDAKVVPALYWETALELSQDVPGIRFINLGGSPHSALSQFKDFLGGVCTEHFRLIHRRASSRVHLLQITELLRDKTRRALGENQKFNRLYRFLQDSRSRFFLSLIWANIFVTHNILALLAELG